MSDLYAMGVTDCDNMLMLLGVSNKMSEKERDVVVPMMMRGFKVILLKHNKFKRILLFRVNFTCFSIKSTQQKVLHN